MPRKTYTRLFRSAPAKAALATGCAAIAASLLALPATAASASGDITIRHSPTESFSFPGLPTDISVSSIATSAGAGGGGGFTAPPVSTRRSTAAKQSTQSGYVSTFSAAPLAPTPAGAASSAACLANSQPVTGPGGDLDIPGITGTSKDVGHVGALPISGLGPASMLPPGIESSDLAQLEVTRTADAASANMTMVASSGYRFPCIHIEVGAGTGYANVEYALVNAGLVADDRAGNTETLTWTYSSILWSYTLPGASSTVHQGSGRINARPDKVSGSLVNDSKAIALGTIGLTVVVSLGLIGLYVVGIRRNRARYRARYQRRTAMREQRAAMTAAAEAAFAAEAELEAAEPEAAEPEAVELEAMAAEPIAPAVEIPAVEIAEAEPEAEVIEEQEQPEAEPEVEAEPEAEAEAKAKAKAKTQTEPEAEATVEPEPEPVAEPEAVEEAEAPEEPVVAEPAVMEAEAAAEPETEPETEAEPAAHVEPASEPEPEPESDAESESELEAELEEHPEGQPVPQRSAT